jgi:hypothetical protein
MEDFDSTKYYLGTLCKRGHDWNGTGMSLRYGSTCVKCMRLASERYKQAKRIKSGQRLVQCPLCPKSIVGVLAHLREEHTLKTKQEIIEAGIEIKLEFVSEKVRQISRANGKRVGRENIDDIVVQKQGKRAVIAIPMHHWSSAGKYAWITFDKVHNIVILRPTVIKRPHYRAVWRGGDQFYINISPRLLEIFDNDEAVFHSENGRIEIHLRNPIHMKAFESWGKDRSGNGITNPMDLRISGKCISINSTVWPVKGQYVTVSWNGQSLFLKPNLTKTPGSLKVTPNNQRFQIRAMAFFKTKPSPKGDWRLMETLPDGTLRFSPWGKGQKRKPKPINPVIDHTENEAPKQPPTDYTPFDEWENE